MKRLMVIINPISGTASKEGIEESIRQDAAQYGFETIFRYTRKRDDATGFAREAIAQEYYGVLACGGDGTVNETARALCGSGVVMGIIPMGSGNGLARHLNIPLTVHGAMRVVGEDRVLDCDYATANGRPFFCTFGVGFDAAVTEKFNKGHKRGLSTYVQTTLDEFIKYRSEEYVIMANGKVISESALLVAVCNASQYGNNAYIAPSASIKDGLLDVTIIHKGNPLQTALAGLDILTGFVGKTGNTVTFRARDITIIRRNTGPAHLDGEPATMGDRIEVTCHPGQLRLFTTARKSQYRKWLSPSIPIVSPIILTLQDLGYKITNLIQR
ncbi:MAG: YegS/Rv2252/BmrU family lipid kinase [Muribaculaceae bacterium]|nr:YegS/Rv2252/BmrU family lipid kinase [Muribaculaceae bacterium]